LLEPVDLVDKSYPRNILGTHDGGLWISTKNSVGNPETDPLAWHCILDAMTTMSVDLMPDRSFKLSVRMATGNVIEDSFNIPFPEHKGIWEEGEYSKGDIITKGHSFWQAMEDTNGAPPGNGWKQILSAPRGARGEPGKSIEGPQGKPGRNGMDAKLPKNFIEDVMALAAERKAFEAGRSGSEAITSFRGYFLPSETYRAGDVVNFDGSLYLCTSSGQYESIARSADAFEIMLGVPKVAFVPYMHWQGQWEQRAYSAGMTVMDGGWTMVANKETTDPAGPQGVGLPYYLYNGTVGSNSDTAAQLITGTRMNNSLVAGFMYGVRLGVVDTYRYQVYAVRNPLGPFPEVIPITEFTANTTGLSTINTGQVIIPSGVPFDVVSVVTLPDPGATNVVALYDYVTPQNGRAPIPGEIVHPRNNPGTMLIDYSSASGPPNDMEIAVKGLTIGDLITDANGFVWTVQGNVDEGSYATVGVTPAIVSSAGTMNFTFTTKLPTVLTYDEDVDYWTNNRPSVQGLFGADTAYVDIVPDGTYYGVDILIQEAVISDDWEVVAYSDALDGANNPGAEPITSSGLPLTAAEIVQLRALL
jgi:hypothetical protein